MHLFTKPHVQDRLSQHVLEQPVGFEMAKRSRQGERKKKQRNKQEEAEETKRQAHGKDKEVEV